MLGVWRVNIIRRGQLLRLGSRVNFPTLSPTPTSFYFYTAVCQVMYKHWSSGVEPFELFQLKTDPIMSCIQFTNIQQV